MGFRNLGIRGVELQVKVTKLQEQCDDMIRGIKFDEDMNATPFDDELLSYCCSIRINLIQVIPTHVDVC